MRRELLHYIAGQSEKLCGATSVSLPLIVNDWSVMRSGREEHRVDRFTLGLLSVLLSFSLFFFFNVNIHPYYSNRPAGYSRGPLGGFSVHVGITSVLVTPL